MSKLLRAVAVGYFGVAAGVVLAAPPLDEALAYAESTEIAPQFVTDHDPAATFDDGVQLAAAGDSFTDDHCCSAVDCGDEVALDLGCGCPSLWTVRAGAVVMHRSRPNAGVIARTQVGDLPISNAADFGFDWAGGPDVSIIRSTAAGNAWEVRYFGVLNSSSSRAYGDPGDFEILPYSFNTSNDLNATYKSTLNSTEINWRRPVTQRITWLAGFRAVELSDHLQYTVGFPSPTVLQENYNMNNHLYGAQTGADVSLWNRGGPLRMNGVVKAGVYGNSASSNFYGLNLTDGTQITEGVAWSNDAAFVGEVDLTATYQVTKHFALRGGYQFTWVDGIALASNTVLLGAQEISDNVIDSDGSLFYNGAMFGGEFAW
ncbi:MAG: BBP7 family outer membrane beta-barrel protein [Planctomycetaceae bacterium]|nr:BBP7 family outer membrane beta-barrel protein [Planctomycetaceae bacterium]